MFIIFETFNFQYIYYLYLYLLSGHEFKIKLIYRFAQNIKTNILERLIIFSCIDYMIVTIHLQFFYI